MTGKWSTEITREGFWPMRWCWTVRFVGRDEDGNSVYDWRHGDTFTKDRARRKIAKARMSMERDSVRVVERSCA